MAIAVNVGGRCREKAFEPGLPTAQATDEADDDWRRAVGQTAGKCALPRPEYLVSVACADMWQNARADAAHAARMHQEEARDQILRRPFRMPHRGS